MERKLKQVYCSNEYCNTPQQLNVTLNDNYESQLSEIKKIIADSAIDIKSINVGMSVLLDANFDEFKDDDFRVGNYYITVYADGSWWLCIFSKYDCADNFEYELMGEEDAE